MITLTSSEIVKITKANLTHDVIIYGAEGLKEWILENRYDNHSWLEMARCHGAMQKMVKTEYLIKIKRGEFVKNPMYD